MGVTVSTSLVLEATTQPIAPRSSSLSSCTRPPSWHASVLSDACGSWVARVSCAASPVAKQTYLFWWSEQVGGWKEERERASCNNTHSMHGPFSGVDVAFTSLFLV